MNNRFSSAVFSIFFFVLLLLTQAISIKAFAQKRGRQLEIMPYVQWDSYPGFSYVFGGRASIDYTKLKGVSRGIQGAYKVEITPSLYIKAGLGYHQAVFNDINGYNTRFGLSEARLINYSSMADVLFYTNKYRYNTIKFHIGIEKRIELHKGLFAAGSLNFEDCYTFSQYYRIIHDYPTGTPKNSYMQYKKRNFSMSGTAQLSIQKRFGNFLTGPAVFLPVYTSWGEDEEFPNEFNNKQRSKWFKGIGVGIQTSYCL